MILNNKLKYCLVLFVFIFIFTNVNSAKSHTNLMSIENNDLEVEETLIKKSRELNVVEEKNEIQDINFISSRSEFIEEIEYIEPHGIMSSYTNLDLTIPCSYTYEELNKFLRYGLEGLGKVYKQAEEEYGVNAMFLIAVSALESNHGRSKIAQEKNNLFGFSSYDVNPSRYSAKYESKEDSILSVAKYLKDNYLNQQGKYYKGKTIKDVNYYYCTNSDWYQKVNEMMTVIDYKIKEAN